MVSSHIVNRYVLPQEGNFFVDTDNQQSQKLLICPWKNIYIKIAPNPNPKPPTVKTEKPQHNAMESYFSRRWLEPTYELFKGLYAHRNPHKSHEIAKFPSSPFSFLILLFDSTGSHFIASNASLCVTEDAPAEDAVQREQVSLHIILCVDNMPHWLAPGLRYRHFVEFKLLR